MREHTEHTRLTYLGHGEQDGTPKRRRKKS